MIEKYYNIEQISEMLNIHPKTIQRYIREGKLNAKKIGKGWRISGHDLSVFAEGVKAVSGDDVQPATPKEEKIRASSVIDIQVSDKNEADRIINILVAAMNVKPPELGRSSMHAQYIEDERRVRITLWGNLEFLTEVLRCISIFTEMSQEG
jgi:excisionase family DNA binding protein